MNSLRYYSTNLRAPLVNFPEALLNGQAPDRGLYMPEQIPVLSASDIRKFSEMKYHEIAFHVLYEFLRGEIPTMTLRDLCHDAYNFEIPLEPVYEKKFVMRLDQGPTASFKDFAARMMGRLMDFYLQKEKRRLLILTATSGDTGSAIANAFLGLDAIDVIVLFPEKEVTQRQRKQMTTLGQNIRVLGLDGKFDDCQALVKQAFADPDLGFLNLSSANSINIGRLLPQSVYYFYAYSRLTHDPGKEKVIFSVPSGNFGDMMGGMLAAKMGLPVQKFIIAVNENDEVPNYLRNGLYHKIEPSRNCISSAMNVGHPSNLARLVAMYGGVMDEKGNIHNQADLAKMRHHLFSVSITDVETRQTIRDAWEQHQLLLEPHGAVGWAGLNRFLFNFPEFDHPAQVAVSLETAHPAKFPEEINKLLGFDPQLPPSLMGIDQKIENFEHLATDYNEFKKYLLQ